MKTLKNVVHACVIAVLVVAVPAYGPVYGQVIEEEDDDVYRRSSTADKFFGTAGSVFVNGSSTRASYQSLELGYDTLFAQERGRFYFNGVGTNTGLELDLELTGRARRENEDNIAEVIRNNEGKDPDEQKVPEERSAQQVTRELDEDNFAVKDAFVQYNFSDNLLFTAGRRRIAWGQFDLISPVNLALPLTPQTTEPVTGKVNTVVPQDQVSFTWLPSERVEVQGYYFPTTNIDFLVEDVLQDDDMDEVYEQPGPEPVPSEACITSNMNPVVCAGPPQMSSQMSSDQQDLTDHSAFAARVLFYFNWGTLGFTYHDGNDSLVFDTPDLATLERLLPLGVTDAEVTTSTNRAYNVRRHIDLPEAENYGIELAIPRGKWVYKFELLHQKTTASLEGQSRPFNEVPGMNDPFLRAEYEYFEAVRTMNNNQLYVPVDRQYIAIGADSDRDKWRFNVSLLTIRESFDSDTDRLLQLEQAVAGGDNVRGDPITLPAINIARYLGGNKEKEIGFVGGFLGAYFGASLYYTARVGENFRWLAGLETISNQRDRLVSDSDDPENPARDSNDYELAEETSSGFRLNLIYDF